MDFVVLDQNIIDCEQNLLIEKNLGTKVTPHQWIIRFWQNEPSIILGRFQRPEYEIIESFVTANNIKVCRRESGGGTVYHDLGTLNFSLVKPVTPPLRAKVKDATVATEIIGTALRNLGLEVIVTDRNAIFIGDKKILGSAASISQGISHYHCSILYNANLENLTNSINWNPLYKDNDTTFVKSHRSPVINLLEVLPTLSLDHLKIVILNEFKKSLTMI